MVNRLDSHLSRHLNEVRGKESISKKVRTTFVMHRLEELPQDRNSGRSQTAGALKAQLARQDVEIPPENGNGVGKAGKARIAADLADDSQNSDGAQLLENVGVAKNGGLDGCGLVAGLVLPDGCEDGRDFVVGEAGCAEDFRSAGTSIVNMVPAGEFDWILGAVADKDAEVVQPGSRSDNVAVVDNVGANGLGQVQETRLVAEFVHREGLGFDVTGELFEGRTGHGTFVTYRWTERGVRMRGNRDYNVDSAASVTDIVTFLLEMEGTAVLHCYCWGGERDHSSEDVVSC